MADTNSIPVKDHEKHLLRHSPHRLREHTDHSRLSPLELLVAITVETGGGFYTGMQPATVAGQHSLVIFQTSFGASLALPLDELSTQSVKHKLQQAHIKFGKEWEE